MTDPDRCYYGTCAVDGKRQYASRKIARKAARAAHPGAPLHVYECCGSWHYGRLPAAVIRGERARPA